MPCSICEAPACIRGGGGCEHAARVSTSLLLGSRCLDRAIAIAIAHDLSMSSCLQAVRNFSQ